MILNFIKELSWRNILNNYSNGVNLIKSNNITGYIGFDPTYSSLHIGHLILIMSFIHLKKHGHNPIIIIGNSTGMIGDPSFKKEERPLLENNIIKHNSILIKKQLCNIISNILLSSDINILENSLWINNYSFIDFIRDIGKYVTVSYMLSKNSVKNRINNGLSFTEFTYQLVQGYDFVFLYKNYNCLLQIGGSDQWGNITTGIELVKKIYNKSVFGITTNILLDANNNKIGKTSNNENIWLDKNKTSPYHFYQFWINIDDIMAIKCIKMMTLLSKNEIQFLENEHYKYPNKKIIQFELAKILTTNVHSKKECQIISNITNILFGNKKNLNELFSDNNINYIKYISKYTISKDIIVNNINVVDFLYQYSNINASKSKLRVLISNNSITINNIKICDYNYKINIDNSINEKYFLIKKGKKNFCICTII